MSEYVITVEGLGKAFDLYNPEEAHIPVFAALDMKVKPGECVCLSGESGVGKSTLMRSIYGNYMPSEGNVSVFHEGAMIEITGAPPRLLVDVRRRTLGYVSQFLRVIPRITTLALVKQPLLENGVSDEEADARARRLLTKLRLPERLWHIPPATFSGGEQQRVNIARSFIREYPIMLLDEPTASLDAGNRETVIALIKETENEKGEDAVRVIEGSNSVETLGDAELHILTPAHHVNEDVNEDNADERYARIHENYGVLKIGCDPGWVLVTGDADLVAFRDHITDYHRDHLPAYVLDAPHHGSISFFKADKDDGPYRDHIEAIAPSFVIVSAPTQDESRHDHPHDDAIELYEEYAEVLHTGAKRESFICDVLEDGSQLDPVSDDGELAREYGLGDGEDDGGGKGDGGGGGAERGPFERPSRPPRPRPRRYA